MAATRQHCEFNVRARRSCLPAIKQDSMVSELFSIYSYPKDYLPQVLPVGFILKKQWNSSLYIHIEV